MRDIVILFAGRFPSEKAASLFVDLNAASLVQAGARVIVLAPRRFGRGVLSATPYRVKYLPTIDLSRVPILWSVANFVSVWVFAKWSFMWLLVKSNARDVIISNDALPLLFATYIRRNTMYEMHDFAKQNWIYRTLLARVRFVLVTNEWKRRAVIDQFSLPTDKVILERNAVDTSAFGTLDKKTAREQLGLNQEQKIIVYTGHLYEWKGADTLAAAARSLPDIQCIFVGGAPADVERFKAAWGDVKNIRLVGHVDHTLVPVWQSAADVLVLPNSGKEEISVHYTSPMKLFEYMASRRTIVASDLPSIKEVLPGEAGFFALPDDESSFSTAITQALKADDKPATAARGIVEQYSWNARAARILSHFV